MKQKIEIADFLGFRFISNPRFSPDGRLVCYVVAQADLVKNGYLKDLWILDTTTGESRKLTNYGDVGSYAWQSDGKVLFSTAAGKAADTETHYYTIVPDSGLVQSAFSVDVPVMDIVPLNDGRLLIYGMHDRRKGSKPRESGAYEVFEETPFWFNGFGFIDGIRRSLYIYDSASNKLDRITDEGGDTNYYEVRGDKLAYQFYAWEGSMGNPMCPSIRICDLKTGEETIALPQRTLNVFKMSWWKDDEILFAGSENKLSDGESEPANLYALTISTGEVRKVMDSGYGIGLSSICSDARMGGGQGAKLDNDGSWYYEVTVNETGTLCRFTPEYTNEQNLLNPDGVQFSIDSFDVMNGRVIAAVMMPGRLAELFLDGRKMTSFNDAYLDTHEVIPLEFHEYATTDGNTVRGYVMKPAGYEAGKKYPAILHVHGGPTGAFGEVYHHEMQMWANAGYFVLYCNPRGSDGRGAEFNNIDGKWGTVDYRNLMDFTDAVIADYPDIDTQHMGVGGGSYGGFMTNWIIGHTHRFAAACAMRSISFMNSFEYVSDIGDMCTLKEQGTTTERNYEELWRQSPLKYAPTCTTPTLFIQADEDYRCYMTDAISMFTCLKTHGVPAKMCLFHGENHELSRSGKPANRISRMEEILDWFNRYLKA